MSALLFAPDSSTYYSFGASVWRVRLALESPSCSLATIGDGDGGGDHHHPTWVTIRLQRRMERRTAVSCKKERMTRVRQLRHIFLAESLCSSVFVSSLHRTDPSRRGLLDFFGFTELFKTYTIYTFTECKESSHNINLINKKCHWHLRFLKLLRPCSQLLSKKHWVLLSRLPSNQNKHTKNNKHGIATKGPV